MTNYGYIKDEICHDHYVLGGGFIPNKQIVNPSGNWSNFLPVFEAQAAIFETWGCTCFGTLNCLEALLKYIKLKESNFSERFPYIGMQIRKPGSSPHGVAEWIRENGLIAQEKLPMTDSYNDFCQPDPLPVNMLIEGQGFLNEWEFKHEWVYTGNDSFEEKTAKLKEALKYSPIGVSVYAWRQNGLVYFKNETDQDNHWTMLYHIDDKGYRHVFDSYEGIKVLTPDYDFDMAKVYFLIKRTEPRDAYATVITNIKKTLLSLLQRLFSRTKKKEDRAARKKAKKKIIKPIEPKKMETPSDKIYATALTFLGKDASPNDEAPDDLGCANTVSAIVRACGYQFAMFTSTYWMYEHLRISPEWQKIDQPEKGAIIISPTGFGNKKIPNGHVGFCGEGDKILSNTSKTGNLDSNFTQDSWRSRYVVAGNYPIYYFRKV